ncbi:PadR family transcriptional regulator [Pseudonocardia nigra]|uniref:PadR family transcriptional regulator n=1 Tax=Pseudonocardia nigra TaxID=1921578 RepID=UPI001FE4C241|nr:PadR family transcriptional regulator [Pseudonocardia nigra]
MNAMNPAWDNPWLAFRGRGRRHAHPRPPFPPHAAAMDAPPPPFTGDEDDADPRGRRRGRRHGAPFGPGFPGMPPMRGPFPGPRGPRGRRGRRTARGDIRAAVLALVAEQPRHGYEIIQEIAERSGGAWRPSPGSVYPTLSQLEDEGLVRVEQTDGRRVVHLTEEGTRYVDEHRAELDAVWESVGRDVDTDAVELWEQLGQLHAAAQQVMAAGTPEQIATATEALAEARKTIYRLLAE